MAELLTNKVQAVVNYQQRRFSSGGRTFYDTIHYCTANSAPELLVPAPPVLKPSISGAFVCLLF